MGRAHLGQKEYEKARECYKKALECDPKKDSLIKGTCLGSFLAIKAAILLNCKVKASGTVKLGMNPFLYT